MGMYGNWLLVKRAESYAMNPLLFQSICTWYPDKAGQATKFMLELSRLL